MPTITRSAGIRLPSDSCDGLHPVVRAAERNHLSAKTNVHAAANVRVTVEVGHHRRDRTADQAVGGLDDGHRLALRARDRGRLQDR